MNPNAFSPNPIDPNRLPGAMPFENNTNSVQPNPNLPYQPIMPSPAQQQTPSFNSPGISQGFQSTFTSATPAINNNSTETRANPGWKPIAQPSSTNSNNPLDARFVSSTQEPKSRVFATTVPEPMPVAEYPKPFIAPSVLESSEIVKKSDEVDPVEADIKRRKRVMFRVLGLLAFIVILFIAMIGTLFLVPRIVAFFSNLAFSTKTATTTESSRIVVTADKSSVASGDTVLLSWNGKIRTDGVYFVQFPCKDGLTASFHSGEAMQCNQPFFFTTTDNTVAIAFTNTTTSSIDLPVYIRYRTADEKTEVVGDTVVSIAPKGAKVTSGTTSNNPIANFVHSITNKNNETKPVVTTTKTPTKTTTTGTKVTTQPSQINGADFTVQLIEIGSMNANNVFTSGAYVPNGDRGAIRFKVTNVGNRTSGNWSFKAILPSDSNPVYQSPVQSALASGQSQDFTLGFPARIGGGNVIVEANADRSTAERSYNNNILNFGFGTTGSTGTSNAGSRILGKDLVLSTIETGRVSGGVFTSAGQFDKTETVAIRFRVTNNGTDASGSWNFSASLPASSVSDQSYVSSTFGNLASGETREYTLNFTGIKDTGNNTITITVDPSNMVYESLENNNQSSALIVGR